MIKRALMKRKIKAGCLEEYIKRHDEIQPELTEEYKRLGIKAISCFINGYDLYIYSEYDSEYEHLRIPENMPFDIQHQELMQPLMDWSTTEDDFEEVYRME